MAGRLISILPSRTLSSGSASDRNAQSGIVLMILATVFFSFQDGVTKTLIIYYPIWELVFIRFCVLLTAVTLVSFFFRGPVAMATSGNVRLHLLRGVILICEIFLIGLSYQYLGLAQAMAIFLIFPVFGVTLAFVFLKEQLALTTLIALAIGVLGLLVASAHVDSVNLTGVFFALGAAVAYAGYLVLTRFTSCEDGPITSIFYICLVGIVLPLVVSADSFIAIAPEHYWLFALLCTFNIVAQGGVIVALSYARASLLQPFNYLQVVWASLVGYLVFADQPGLDTILGSILIFGSGFLVIYANSKRPMTN
jgi:drug/metabolite transporter (DMT)-like permease